MQNMYDTSLLIITNIYFHPSCTLGHFRRPAQFLQCRDDWPYRTTRWKLYLSRCLYFFFYIYNETGNCRRNLLCNYIEKHHWSRLDFFLHLIFLFIGFDTSFYYIHVVWFLQTNRLTKCFFFILTFLCDFAATSTRIIYRVFSRNFCISLFVVLENDFFVFFKSLVIQKLPKLYP